MKKISGFFLFLNFVMSAFAQDMQYTHNVLNKLCSPKFGGRGYEDKCDQKAAKFLVGELKKIEVKHFTTNYLQKFQIRINTFPSDMEVKIGDSVFEAGKDFIIEPFSGSLKGKFELVVLKANELRSIKTLAYSDFSTKVVAIDTAGMNEKKFKEIYDEFIQSNFLKAKAYIEILDKRPMFGRSFFQLQFPVIQIERNKFPVKAKTIEISIKNKFIKDYQTQNVIGYIQGKTDSFIVFTAHYDHLGKLGKKAYFPGANDNGSGVTMLLNLAKKYVNQQNKYSLAFIFFTGEEIGLVGSKYYTENPVFPLEKIKLLINLDVIGSGDKGIQVVNSTIFKPEFDKLVQINKEKNYFVKILPRGEAANSDHYFFYEKGVKSFFIYTLGDYKEYHNIYDRADAVPLNKYENLFKLLTEFVSKL